MNEETDPQPAGPIKPRQRRAMRGWLRGLLLILFGVGGLLLWASWRPKLPVGPVCLNRGDNGQLVPKSGKPDSSGLHLELNAGTLKASNSFSTMSSEGRSNGARFACRRLVIVNQSDHFLMARVGAAMLSQLKDLRGFKQIDYYPFGEKPPLGDLAPDLTVTLDLAEIKTSGFPGSRKLHARIVMTVGRGWYDYPVHSFDGLGPPVIQLSGRTTLEHDSTTTGIGTPSSRFKLAAEDIAKQLGKGLTDKLNELYEKDGPLPVLPDRFYPAYARPPDLPVPDDARIELVSSHHGLMTANESLWRLETDRPLPDVLKEFERQLAQHGWKTKSIETDPNTLPHLSMSRQEDTVMVYPQRKDPQFGPREIATQHATAEETQEEGEGAQAQRVLFVYYVDRMSREERVETLDELFDSGATVDTLLMFDSMMNQSMRDRLVQRVETDPPTTPEAWLWLARSHKRRNEPEEAKQAVLRAHLLARTVVASDGESQQQVREQAKKLGVKLPEQVAPAPGELESMGFEKLESAMVLERELALDQEAVFYALAGDQLTTMLVRVVAQYHDNKPTYALYCMKAIGGSRSWGTTSLDQFEHIDGLGSVHFQVEQTDETPRFKLVVTVDAT